MFSSENETFGTSHQSGPPNKQSNDAANAAYSWQQDRRKPDGRFNMPISGFGPGPVHHTLWVPNNKAGVVFKFVDGEPVREVLTDCFAENPIMAAARETVFRTFRSVNGVYTCDTAFLKYAAVLVSQNYNLTDADLNLLLQGDKWHDGVMRHLLGGDDNVRLLASLRTAMPMPIAPPALAPIARADEAEKPVKPGAGKLRAAAAGALRMIGLKN